MQEESSSFTDSREENVQRAIFRILTDDNTSGTGFLVKDQCHVLTARHVIEDVLNLKDPVVKVIINDKACEARIEKDLPEWDVALLRLDIPLEGIYPIDLEAKKLVPRAKFRSYGFPQSFDAGWYNGEFAGLSQTFREYDIQFDLSYQPRLEGLSGGPVFFEDEYTVVAFVSEHGPHPRAGKVISVESFYGKLFAELQEPKERPWCYVILSEADEARLNSHRYTLRNAVIRSVNLLENDPNLHADVKNPVFNSASKIVSQLTEYRDAVKQLCLANIAIFDITNYEPAIMLLLGIRSVVKRGVTIVSYGDDFVMGDPINLPFNITDINIVSHSKKQQERGDQIGVKEITPPYIIRDKIKEGLAHLHSLPQYLDLPTFDAIRNLPPKYRKPDSNDVLVLCSYSEVYKDRNWKILWAGLKEQLDKKTGGGPASRVLRILDLKSPRLASHTIYEAIRCMVLCVVDFTEWRPNAFFEFGVRLAVTNNTGYTVCIIENTQVEILKELVGKLEEIKDYSDQTNKMICQLAGIDASLNSDHSSLQSAKRRYSQIVAQCEHLLNLFKPYSYNCFSDEEYDDQSQYEAMMYHFSGTGKVVFKGKMGRASNDAYEVIEENIDVDGEVTSTPVYLELLRTAQLFDVEDTEAQATVLYPNNETLISNVAFGVVQRFLAIWYFIRNEYSSEKIVSDAKLLNIVQEIMPKLSSRLRKDKPFLAEEIRYTARYWSYLEMWSSIRDKYSEQDIINDPSILKPFQDINSKLVTLKKELVVKLASSPSFSKPKLMEEIDSTMSSLQSLLDRKRD